RPGHVIREEAVGNGQAEADVLDGTAGAAGGALQVQAPVGREHAVTHGQPVEIADRTAVGAERAERHVARESAPGDGEVALVKDGATVQVSTALQGQVGEGNGGPGRVVDEELAGARVAVDR